MSWRAGIHGYVAQWGVVTAPLGRPLAPHLSRPALYQRGCFAFDPHRVAVWFMHREGQSFGVGSAIELDMWEDDYGLAFAFVPPPTSYSLVCGIAQGRYAECSPGIKIAESTIVWGVEHIGFAVVDEISICPRGACPEPRAGMRPPPHRI